MTKIVTWALTHLRDHLRQQGPIPNPPPQPEGPRILVVEPTLDFDKSNIDLLRVDLGISYFLKGNVSLVDSTTLGFVDFRRRVEGELEDKPNP